MSYDDTQLNAVLVECVGCGKPMYMTHPKAHCAKCRQDNEMMGRTALNHVDSVTIEQHTCNPTDHMSCLPCVRMLMEFHMKRAEVLEQSRTWQPIATAPKDGTDVLTFGMAGPVVARYEDDAWCVYNYGYEDATVRKMPTHWMPLPTPPVENPTPQKPEQRP